MRYAILSLLFLLGLGSVSAQRCKSATSVVSDINRELNRQLKRTNCTIFSPMGCLRDAAKYSLLTSRMNTYFNGRQSRWSNIGPRRLDFGRTSSGRIVSNGGRMFISAVPSNKRTMKVTIQEKGGRGKVSYSICSVDARGRYTNLKTGWFNELSSQKRKKDEVKTHTLSNVEGKLISIHFDGKSAGNTFSYAVKVR